MGTRPDSYRAAVGTDDKKSKRSPGPCDQQAGEQQHSRLLWHRQKLCEKSTAWQGLIVKFNTRARDLSSINHNTCTTGSAAAAHKRQTGSYKPIYLQRKKRPIVHISNGLSQPPVSLMFSSSKVNVARFNTMQRCNTVRTVENPSTPFQWAGSGFYQTHLSFLW